MCLYLEENSTADIADTDITVYKVFINTIEYDHIPVFTYSGHTSDTLLPRNNVLLSPYKKMEYLLGGTYHVDDFKTQSDASELDDLEDQYKSEVHIGIHTFASREDAIMFAKFSWSAMANDLVVAECTIPKGTAMFKGVFFANMGAICKRAMLVSYASQTLTVNHLI